MGSPRKTVLAVLAASVIVVAAATHFSALVNPGKRIYDGSCASCHEPGTHGAPRAGNVADWRPRMEGGSARLYAVALKGKTSGDRIMPARGGNAKLTDTEVKQAVDYLVGRAQRSPGADNP